MKCALIREMEAFPLIMPMHLFSAFDCTNWGKLGSICGFGAIFETFSPYNLKYECVSFMQLPIEL
jgi:hypothetical protein